MRVRVLFFGMLKDMVGKPVDAIDLPNGSSVREVLSYYEERIPRLKDSLPSLALAVNQQYAGPDTKLNADDEVALLPPVSGGAPEGAGETPPRQPAGRRRYASIVREIIDTQSIV
ncbi:MAG TPA: MoaD/ThiS family protein, partial [Candidatus Binatus sp.]|nr:MoaD/ThiS family protein [Candidatus Binatus sp.]